MKNTLAAAPRGVSRKRKTLIFGGIAIILIFAASRFSSPTNVAQTDSNDSDKRLHPRTYNASREIVTAEIRALIPQLRTYGRVWKMRGAKVQDPNVIYIEVPVLVFTDDLTVTLSKENAGASTRVEVRSASRVGKSDFGENRRHVVQFLTALDARLR